MISRRPYLLALLLALITACTNDLPTDTSGQKSRIQFPSSLTLEKLLGVTWKIDHEKQEVIPPQQKSRGNLSAASPAPITQRSRQASQLPLSL